MYCLPHVRMLGALVHVIYSIRVSLRIFRHAQYPRGSNLLATAYNHRLLSGGKQRLASAPARVGILSIDPTLQLSHRQMATASSEESNSRVGNYVADATGRPSKLKESSR